MKTLAVVLLLATACASFALTPDDEQMLNEDAVERAIISSIPNAPGLIRQGEVLTIKSASGTVVFKNTPGANEGYSKYTLARLFPIDGGRRTDFAVRHDSYEGRRFSLVNGQTGHRIELPGLPILSPDRRHYLAANLDLEARHNPNIMVVVAASDFSEKFRFDFNSRGDWPYSGASDALWVSPDKIFFIRRTIDSNSNFLPPQMMKLELIDSKWDGPREVK